MDTSDNPQAAADQGRATYRKTTAQLGILGLDTAIPEGVRAVAEKTVAQSRDVYDRSQDALDTSIATFEKSFAAAGRGATAFNRRIIALARRNLDSVFDWPTAGQRQESRRDRGIAESKDGRKATNRDLVQ